jgi:hypothetical protein
LRQVIEISLSYVCFIHDLIGGSIPEIFVSAIVSIGQPLPLAAGLGTHGGYLYAAKRIKKNGETAQVSRPRQPPVILAAHCAASPKRNSGQNVGTKKTPGTNPAVAPVTSGLLNPAMFISRLG